MFVYILNQHHQPLMPCRPQKARTLLKQGQAKVWRRTPFTLKLCFGSSGYKQPITASMDTGFQTLATAVVANGKVLYQAEVHLRHDIRKRSTGYFALMDIAGKEWTSSVKVKTGVQRLSARKTTLIQLQRKENGDSSLS